MLVRVLTVIAVAVLVVAAFLLVRLYTAHRGRQARAMPQDRLWNALGTRPDGRATIVDFWTPACGDCRVQAAELQALAGPDVRVVAVDATEQLDVARAFGVFSAPSTAVLAADGRLLHINRRLAPRQVLRSQLGLESLLVG